MTTEREVEPPLKLFVTLDLAVAANAGLAHGWSCAWDAVITIGHRDSSETGTGHAMPQGIVPPMVLIAQAMSIAHIAILLIVVGGIIGITLVILRQAGIAIPDFVVTILWIVLAVVVGVLAIRFVASYL